MDESYKLKIEYVPLDKLKPYERNARKHGDKDIDAIAASIKRFGFKDPIGVWGKNIIVEGHGRLLAAKKLNLAEVPIIRLDDLTDEERRMYALAHNKTAELSAWDFDTLKQELNALKAEFNKAELGFDIAKENTGLADWFEREEKDGDNVDGESEEYANFVEKFKGAKTTDDCYTPENIYDAVANWVSREYGIDRSQFVRPFYPGGDYKAEKYPAGCVVVDNPPFSILAEIVDFYTEHGIRLFLFAPGLAALNYVNREKICAICTYAQVMYENGATVCTSFLTNLENPDIIARSVPELYSAIETANDINEKAIKNHFPKYEYPNEVLTAARFGWLAKYGQSMTIHRDECVMIRQLDAMKEFDKGIFGNALLLSERAAAERAAAERAAAERAAATVWHLSEREREIVRGLSCSGD